MAKSTVVPSLQWARSPKELSLFFIGIIFMLKAVSGENGLVYHENVGNFVPLDEGRIKRAAGAESGVVEQEETKNSSLDTGLKLTNETEGWDNATVNTTANNFIYYDIITNDPPSEAELKKYWIDVGELLKSKNVTGHAEHPLLTNSYRRAVNYEPKFGIPFYGHMTHNLTMATGGFCYVGEHMHSWLAATQYIAPLMANFETRSEESSILYADTGSVVIVEWKDVRLRHQTQHGTFTFQVQLHADGDIWFLYKEIPVELEDVSDAHHPRKVGLSDAYLFHHHFPQEEGSPPWTKSKRVIYEYHRVEIDLKQIVSNRVIRIKAKETCIALKSCHECMNASLEHFECNWCPQKEGDSFCSDTQGFHRRRQEWINSSCKEQKSLAYCLESEKEEGHPSRPPPPFGAPRPHPPGPPDQEKPPVVIVTNEPRTGETKEGSLDKRKGTAYSTKKSEREGVMVPNVCEESRAVLRSGGEWGERSECWGDPGSPLHCGHRPGSQRLDSLCLLQPPHYIRTIPHQVPSFKVEIPGGARRRSLHGFRSYVIDSS